MYIKHVNQEQVDYFKGRIKDTLLKTIKEFKQLSHSGKIAAHYWVS